MQDWREQVYSIVKNIPRGKVSTYGTISKFIGNRTKNKGYRVTPRMVGWALHQNPDPQNIPCHRVVNAKGELAKNYAFGGVRLQKERLLNEGVVFKANRVVMDVNETLTLYIP
ncbi:MAG: MGMT family protein [bacterium]|nr:MGMT family protein [bacterium]